MKSFAVKDDSQKSPHAYKVLLSLAVLIFTLCGSATAQLMGKGEVRGTVTDQSGAVIPNAEISIVNTDSGVTATTTTTSTGEYNFPALNPGNYTVTVTASGFQKLTQEHVTVNALESQTFNPKLTVGSSTESVVVTAAPPVLETGNAILGATMENEMYSALPLQMGAGGQPDQRRATDFAALMPGVSTVLTNGNLTTNTGTVNGSGPRGASSGVYIEGLPFTMASGEGDPRFVWTAISVDAVSQFQVQTNGYPAPYEGMGVQNYSVKQGGNRYHGAVYEYFRNTVLDTWGFFKAVNPATGQLAKPVEHNNEYGINLSGPIWPKLKDRLFFFGNYNGYRYSRVTPTYVTFPTLAQQGGDFRANNVKIYDPTTQKASCTGTTPCRTQMQDTSGNLNVIPASKISPLAREMQSWIPSLTNQQLANNFISQNSSALSNWSTTDRIDFVVTPQNTLSFLAAIGRQASSVPVGQTTSGRNTGPVPYNYGQAYAPKTAVGAIEDTHVFTAHLVNQFKYGFARYNGPTINANATPKYAATTLGFSGLPTGNASDSFPIVTFSGNGTLQTQWGGTSAGTAIANSYILIDNVQWSHGNHSLTFGAELAWMQYQTINGASSDLTLATHSNQTAGLNGSTIVSGTGLAYASFLLGYINQASFTQYGKQETGARFRPFSPYVQDDWKISPRLTVNLGLRWDLFPPYREANDALSFFNPSLVNPATGVAGALQFAGHGTGTCNCRTNINTFYKNFGPRIGFAYQTDPKTVLRGSFGLIFSHGNGVGGAAVSRTGTGTLGYSAGPSFAASTSTYLPTFYMTGSTATIPNYTSAQGVASGAAYGTGYVQGSSQYGGTPSTVGYGDPNRGGRAPEFVVYSLGLQHQWTEDLATTISYVGTSGHFIYPDGSNARGYWANQLDPKYLALGSSLNTKISALPGGYATFAANNNLPYYSNFSTSQTLATALRAFPFNGVSDTYGQVANSYYSALQLSVQKRFSKGYTFMANYTWSRTIDNAGTFRSGYDIPAAYSNTGKAWKADAIERSVSAVNQPQKFVFTSVWDLPFGKGALGGASAWTRAIFGGFKFSDIVTINSGSPLVITASSCQTNPAQSTCMPNLNPNFHGSARANGKWGKGITYSNTAISYITPSGVDGSNNPTGPFIAPTTALLNSTWAPSYTFGNSSRTAPYNLYGPGNYNLDISLRRSFNLHVTEGSNLNLQADMYNLTNHTQFGGIGTTVGSSNFGQVSTQANMPRDIQLSARIEF